MVSWLSMIVSCLALFTSLVTWYKMYQKRKYDVADAILSELLKITLEYPELRDPHYCSAAIHNSDTKIRYQYESYAILCWNYLETLYDTYGKGLKKSPFYGAMRDLGERHKEWLFTNNNLSYYNAELVKFLRIEV